MVRSLGAAFTSSTSSKGIAPAVAIAAIAYYLLVLGVFARFALTGTNANLLASFALAFAPLAVWIALRNSLIVPFCVYIAFMPFDSLSYLGGSGTFTKLLGLATAAAIFPHVLRRGNFVKPPSALVGWAALLTLMTASVFWSIDASNATYYLQMYASLVALYALLSIVRVRRVEFFAILAATLVAGIVSAGFDAYLFRSHQNVIDAGGGVSRVIISAGNATIDPNELSLALVLPFAIGLFMLFNAPLRWVRALMIPTLATLIFGFSSSGSRGGFVALATVFAYLLVRSRHRLWLAALAFASVASALVANPGLPARFAAAQGDGAAGRSDIWRIGFAAFRAHWLYGAGVGNFADAFDQQYIHVFVRYVMGWHWVAHNVPLTIATELGVIGLTVYFVAFGLQFSSLRGRFVGTPLFELRLALEGACLAMFVAGLSTSTLNAKFVWLMFSLMSLARSFDITLRTQANSRDGTDGRVAR